MTDTELQNAIVYLRDFPLELNVKAGAIKNIGEVFCCIDDKITELQSKVADLEVNVDDLMHRIRYLEMHVI